MSDGIPPKSQQREAPFDRIGACLRSIDGGAAVELAFVLPVLVLILLGMIEFGRLMWTKSNLQYAIEETARYAIANPAASYATLRSFAVGRVMGVDQRQLTTQVTNDATCGESCVKIEMTYQFQFATTYLPVTGLTLYEHTSVQLPS